MTMFIRQLARLARERRAVSLIEFGLCLPLLVIASMWTIEYANYTITREQLSQLALQVADNAARIGTQTSLQTQIDEKQINDLFVGAGLQSGKLDIKRNGRIILSSLEVDSSFPWGQYIHWQRCYGDLAYNSSYGVQGDGKGSIFFPGMGESNARIRAGSAAPAMFVEIGYTYQPIISSRFAPNPGITIREVAAMMVRDNRDTSDPGINPVAGVTPSRCS